MFKRLFCLLTFLTILTLSAVAAAETTLVYDGTGETAGALAAALAGAAGWTPEAAESGGKALDAAGSGDALALLSQAELMAGLQGYANTDVRASLQLLLPVCQDDLYLVCSGETGTAMGIRDFPSMLACLEENPFGLQILRCFDASVADYAAVQIYEALDFDTETFADLASCAENLDQGSYVMVTDTAMALAMAEKGAVVLGALTAEPTAAFPALPCAGECGVPVCRGTVWGIYLQAGKETGMLREEVLPALASAELAALLSDRGLRLMGEDDFDLTAELAAIVAYMTSEGLFFYD